VPYDGSLGIKSDLSIGIFNIFRENNIEIPFPQVDLNVKEPVGNIKIDKKNKE